LKNILKTVAFMKKYAIIQVKERGGIGMVENFKTENFKTVTVRIPEEKWKMIKKILVDEDKTFQIILEEALDEFLKKHQNK